MFDFEYEPEPAYEPGYPTRYGRIPTRRPANADERRYTRREAADISGGYDEVDERVRDALVDLTEG